MEVVVTTGAIRHAKCQSNHHHQHTPNFLQAGCPSCRQTNSVKALKGGGVKTFLKAGYPTPNHQSQGTEEMKLIIYSGIMEL